MLGLGSQFFTAGLLFFAPSSASILGSLSHPAETGLLIPSVLLGPAARETL
jgi:hypothetical protein